MRAVAHLPVAAFLLAGCAHHPSVDTYESGEVGWTIETAKARVVSSRTVEILGELNNREGIEYILRMADGRTVTLVQNRASEAPPLRDGTPVLVQVSGSYTRALADPRAERVGAADWIDPDTLREAKSPSAGDAPTTREAKSPSVGDAPGTREAKRASVGDVPSTRVVEYSTAEGATSPGAGAAPIGATGDPKPFTEPPATSRQQ